MEHQGICDDGARHAAGLGHVGHAEQAGDGGGDGGAGGVELVQDVGRLLDARFQRVRRSIHGALRHRHEPHHVGDVIHRAFQPALFGEADRIIVALGEDAVRQAGRLQRGVEVVGLGHVFGVAERDGGLDGPAGGGHLQAEPVLRLRLDGGGGKVLRLHDDGRATGGRDEYVGTQARSPGDGLRVFGDHVAARQHGL